METYYNITITKYYTEADAELGREYKIVGKREDGSDNWGTTESRRGPKDTQRTEFSASFKNLDLKAITAAIHRANK